MSEEHSPDGTGEEKVDAQAVFEKISDKNEEDTCIYARYSETSEQYDMTVVVHNYNGPRETAAIAAECFTTNRDNVYILDVAAGTGLCAVELRKHGFLKMDAMDASPGMLDRAKEKGLYDRYTVGILGENTLDTLTDTYDAIVMCGFSIEIMQRLPIIAFEELIRIVKKGGYIINTGWATMFSDDDAKSEDLRRKFKILEEQGKWKLVQLKRFHNYFKGYDGTVSVHMICT
ncbi:methyltransferase-like protein 27 [Haliotis rufescens]|uniref:methyltransferase-like protein 27 n=1 Tax=Haliotis rufescens TaxID=6454 RepID=UPI00201F26DE|nr:methyltransferase-like protein 27 [Haliotis rufescens]XP_046341471.2 methyltransferase-like protein 27 [Haliotis rufescens]